MEKTHKVHGKAADKNQLAFTARTRIWAIPHERCNSVTAPKMNCEEDIQSD